MTLELKDLQYCASADEHMLGTVIEINMVKFRETCMVVQ